MFSFSTLGALSNIVCHIALREDSDVHVIQNEERLDCKAKSPTQIDKDGNQLTGALQLH